MKIIQRKYYKADKVLGQQKPKDDSSWRFLTYCVALPCDDGVLLHNVMTKEMLLLEGEECNMLNTADLNFSPVLQECNSPLFEYLFANWYIVSETHDDKTLCLSLRTVLRQLQEAKLAGKINAFTILTTTDCNARCFYCYERGCKHEDMSDETAHRVVDFIKRSCGGDRVHLSWFGGEPLYNLEPIDIITNGLEKEGIKYVSYMVTNGYLFDEEMINKAREKWHLVKAQITLDGTEEVYNRRKAYIYKDVNAFARVTDNIESLLKAGIRVIVRLNLDAKNYDDLFNLADYLVARYTKYGKFRSYSQYILKGDGSCPISGDLHSLIQNMVTLNERLGRKNQNRRIAPNVSIYQCMSDNPASVLIQTDGVLGKCEHYFNSHPCGTIEKGLCNAEEVARFSELDIYPAECEVCPIYPNCIRLAMCIGSFVNNKGKSTKMCSSSVDWLKQGMLSMYEFVKKR